MRKKYLALPLFAIILFSMACTIGYEGLVIGSDPEVEKIEDLTATAEQSYASQPNQPASTPEPTALRPTDPPAAPQNPAQEPESTGAQEYSVSATNFDCICQVDGNVTVEFNFKGDQLEVVNPGGSVNVYDKIGDNRYRRSWMGYYILTSGEGENATETKVEEERSVVIILNDDGYVMEHYQGTSGSPCCFHTFTNQK